MSSFGENKSMKMLKEEPLAWLQYNRRMMCRIYPAGGRFDSSNYNPMPLWTVGSQLGKLVVPVFMLLCGLTEWVNL